ncbi:MAG: type-2 restriction enzyme TthHB8I [Fimbriimonadales bacterium]|nr:MAG: type-2 restriction enzyme TthHB8I [Fimbriimonadales bacterium]
MNTPASDVLKQFEKFLESIPLEQYRAELLPIKTVEQDLPKSLNPLPAIYEAYWTDKVKEFPTYDQFFEDWWSSHLRAIDEFVRKYFWGCSWEFVRLGFKARLYRTTVSVLTQFHFCYAWKSQCISPLEANWELDLRGVDAEVSVENERVALQIKKETYRSEAASSGRFAKRRQEYRIVVEIPYTLTRPEEWKSAVEKARLESRRRQAKLLLFCASHLQRWLGNGFVVFQSDYPSAVEKFIKQKVSQEADSHGSYSWDLLIEGIMNHQSAGL